MPCRSLLFRRRLSKDINPGVSLSFLGVHCRHHTPVATAFKLVKSSPMLGEIHRLEEVHLYRRTKRIQDQSRKAQCRSPSGREKLALHRPTLPRPCQCRDLVMVDSARGQRSVNGEPRIGCVAEICYFVHKSDCSTLAEWPGCMMSSLPVRRISSDHRNNG